MITLSFLQLLQDNGFGEIDVDLFFQKITVDKSGVFISDISEPSPRGTRNIQSYELFSRGKNDVEGYKKLEAIRNFLINSYSSICELPPVPRYDVESTGNVTVTSPSTITNIGLDANSRIVYSIQGSIIY